MILASFQVDTVFQKLKKAVQTGSNQFSKLTQFFNFEKSGFNHFYAVFQVDSFSKLDVVQNGSSQF